MSTVNIPITGDATSLVAATQKANAALNTIGVAADNAGKKIAPAMNSLSGGAQKAAAALGPCVVPIRWRLLPRRGRGARQRARRLCCYR